MQQLETSEEFKKFHSVHSQEARLQAENKQIKLNLSDLTAKMARTESELRAKIASGDGKYRAMDKLRIQAETSSRRKHAELVSRLELQKRETEKVQHEIEEARTQLVHKVETLTQVFIYFNIAIAPPYSPPCLLRGRICKMADGVTSLYELNLGLRSPRALEKKN